MAGLLFSVNEIRTKGDGSSVCFLWQLGDFFYLNKKRETCDFKVFFPAIFRNKNNEIVHI